MLKEIVIDEYGLGNAIAVRSDGDLIDLYIDPVSDQFFYPPKTYLLASIDRRVPNRGGYFIKLPNGQAGYLVSKKLYSEGTNIKVVSGVFYEKGKPQRFSDKLKLVTKHCIVSEGKGEVKLSKNLSENIKRDMILKMLEAELQEKEKTLIILRKSINNLEPKQVVNICKLALASYRAMLSKVCNREIFYHGLAKNTLSQKYNLEEYNVIENVGAFDQLGIWDDINDIENKRIMFGKGSYINVEQTTAFCVFDVNSGSDLSTSQQEINWKAAEKICSLIKIKGLGGKIIIDFLPDSRQNKKSTLNIFHKNFSNEKKITKIWGWNISGSFEMERARDKVPLKIILENFNTLSLKKD